MWFILYKHYFISIFNFVSIEYPEFYHKKKITTFHHSKNLSDISHGRRYCRNSDVFKFSKWRLVCVFFSLISGQVFPYIIIHYSPLYTPTCSSLTSLFNFCTRTCLEWGPTTFFFKLHTQASNVFIAVLSSLKLSI